VQQPVGYQFIIEALGLDLPPLLRPGCIERVRTVQETETDLHQAPVLYPEAMWPGDRLFDHLRFALEHEGVQPGVLKAFGNRTDLPRLILDDATQSVRPLHRRLAFMHTFLTGEIVPLAVAKGQRYIDVANPRLQFVLDKGDLDPAYRVRNNLLGNPRFCPQVFKSARMLAALRDDSVAGNDPWANCPPELQERIEHYLYHHETQASWKIEREPPHARRIREFVSLLRLAHLRDFMSETGLAELQRSITGQRSQAGQPPWRTEQVWVGFADREWQEVVVLLGAPPATLPRLMAGLLACHRRLRGDSNLPPVVHAACTSFPLVYIHPFSDGNGRAHRFLLHNVLAQRGYLPADTIFPLSAWLLKNRRAYVASMTPTCQGIVDMARMRWLPESRMEVTNDVEPFFQYMDLTGEVAALYHFVQATVREEMEPSIDFMVHFDDARQQLEGHVDWPYRRLSLFINLCHQNGGRLSKNKRALSEFRCLPDAQLARLEACVQRAFGFEAGD